MGGRGWGGWGGWGQFIRSMTTMKVTSDVVILTYSSARDLRLLDLESLAHDILVSKSTQHQSKENGGILQVGIEKHQS